MPTLETYTPLMQQEIMNGSSDTNGNKQQMYALIKQYQAEMAKFSIECINQYQRCQRSVNNYLIEACYNLRSYQKAMQFLQYVSQRTPETLTEYAELERELKLRVREQTSGVYDFKQLHGITIENPFPRIDCSDYVNPNIKFIQMNTGIFIKAKSLIKAGSLLIVEKALAFSNDPDYACAVRDLQDQITQNIQVVNTRTSECSEIFMDQNIKQFPFDYRHLDVEHTTKQSKLLKQYTKQLNTQQLIEHCLTSVYDYQVQNSKFNLSYMASIYGRGIFEYEQMFRNSCMNNASISYLGDIMIVTALEDIPKNAMITVNRISPLLNCDVKYDYQRHHLDYCPCLYCQRLTKVDCESLQIQCDQLNNQIDEISHKCQKEPQQAQQYINNLINDIEFFEVNVLDKLPIGIRKIRNVMLKTYLKLIQLLETHNHIFLGRTYCSKYLETVGFSIDEIFQGNFEYSSHYIVGQPIIKQNDIIDTQLLEAQEIKQRRNILNQRFLNLINNAEQQPKVVQNQILKTLTGFHENHLVVIRLFIRLNQLIIENKLDTEQNAIYAEQIQKLTHFSELWSRRCFGWSEAGDLKYN